LTKKAQKKKLQKKKTPKEDFALCGARQKLRAFDSAAFPKRRAKTSNFAEKQKIPKKCASSKYIIKRTNLGGQNHEYQITL
jgi:hypothetical protein